MWREVTVVRWELSVSVESLLDFTTFSFHEVTSTFSAVTVQSCIQETKITICPLHGLSKIIKMFIWEHSKRKHNSTKTIKHHIGWQIWELCLSMSVLKSISISTLPEDVCQHLVGQIYFLSGWNSWRNVCFIYHPKIINKTTTNYIFIVYKKENANRF